MPRSFVFLFALLTINACTGIPDGVEPVKEFDLNKYLGKWYEIARLDHSFERGLDKVTAEYSLRNDGGVKVVNKGYANAEKKWKEAEGRAYFVRGSDEGYLKVSFFGPFYGSYIIFELDEKEYRYAFVSGPDKSYLWLLSRTPEVPDELIGKFFSRVKSQGIDTDNVILVKHD
ncbi:MAG: lipocalin [Gammaproteobacteria bacterium]|nr:MAG: lipocalin [Gammaproteobacteria bacterium]